MAELLAANQITIAKVLDGEKGEKGETGGDGYSPTVTTGTSSDGSTTVTVTNKDGSTTTTLVDGTARVDIDTLSDKTRSGYIETLSGSGFVQSTKTEDGGTAEVVVYGKSVQNGTPWIGTEVDSTSYLFRAMPSQSNDYNRESLKIVGGTVAWNQLAKTDDYNYSTNGITITRTAGTGITNIVVSDNVTGWAQYAVNPTKVMGGHKYALIVDKPLANGVEFYITYVTEGVRGEFPAPRNQATIVNAVSESTDCNIYIGAATPAGTYEYNIQLFDLTQMFGSTIADYIYSLEQSQAGAGVAWFKKLFPKDYYAYNAGELLSVEGLSAHVMRDADNSVIGNYPLDSSLTLRGIPKLDASNNLYYDGDEYTSDGKVKRNTILRAYQSGDESLANAITDGTNTVVYSANASTETATPYTNPQIVSKYGTEEFVSTGILPVGHNSTYSLACPISGCDNMSIEVCGKNLFDINKMVPDDMYVENGELHLVNEGGDNNNIQNGQKLSDLADLEVGETYTINANSTYSNKAIYLNTSKKSWTFGTSTVITQEDLDSLIGWYGKGAIISNIQIELGSTATDYEPYQAKTATLSDIVLRSTPDGTRDKLFKDTDRLWKVERNVGKVDLGTLDWTLRTTGTSNKLLSASVQETGMYNVLTVTGLCSDYSVIGKSSEPELISAINTAEVGLYFYNAETLDYTIYMVIPKENSPSGTLVYPLATPTYETLSDSIQAELNALTTYNPITNVMVSDGVTPDIDVSFWTRDYYAKNAAENASKVATNFLGYDSTNGLIVGNKTSGSWSGYRSQILPGSFNILDESSTVLASFGPTTIIGEEAKANMHLTFNNLSMVDKDGTTLFEVGDNRNAEGIATIKHTAMVVANSAGTATVTVDTYILSIISVYADSVQLSNSSYSFSQKDVTINNLTANSQTRIEITYTTKNSSLYLTFGNRDSSGKIGRYSAAEGQYIIASGQCSHAEGSHTEASGADSHAEGNGTNATGRCSHAEGIFSTASGTDSHAEGYDTKASGDDSHAEGYSSKASGNGSHAEGRYSEASGEGSHAGGRFTVADGDYMTAIGKYNTKNSGKAFVVGNGEDDKARSDAFTVDWSGNTVMKGGLALGTALSIANGGTGATTAAVARTNLGLSGAQVKTLLWTNASPTSAFANQTLSLGLSGYEAVEIEYCFGSSYTNVVETGIYKKSYTQQYMTCHGDIKTNDQRFYISQRLVTVTASGATFGKGTSKNVSGAVNGVEDDTYCVPLKIYGIKEV